MPVAGHEQEGHLAAGERRRDLIRGRAVQIGIQQQHRVEYLALD